MNNIVLILISCVPVIILLKIIYDNDKIEKEPKWLLFLIFIGGCISFIVTKELTKIYSYYMPELLQITQETFDLMLISFAGIAIIEEVSKYIILNIFTWRSKYFNEVYDAVLYSVFISLGFCVIENIVYLMDGNIQTLILRSAFSVPAHTCFGILMGYNYGFSKYYSKNTIDGEQFYYRYAAFFFPVIFHGAYDYILSSNQENTLIIFLIYIFIMGSVCINFIIKLIKFKLTFKNRKY